jgi:Flp pilus assembly protein TadG
MRRRDDDGMALVEFALMLPVVVILIVGLFDAALAVWQSNTLVAAAREGTRYAIVHGSSSASRVGPGSASFTAPDQDSVVTGIVRSYATGVASVSVASTWPDGNADRGSRVSVVATASYTPVLSQVFTGGGLRVTLRGASQQVIHY